METEELFAGASTYTTLAEIAVAPQLSEESAAMGTLRTMAVIPVMTAVAHQGV